MDAHLRRTDHNCTGQYLRSGIQAFDQQGKLDFNARVFFFFVFFFVFLFFFVCLFVCFLCTYYSGSMPSCESKRAWFNILIHVCMLKRNSFPGNRDSVCNAAVLQYSTVDMIEVHEMKKSTTCGPEICLTCIIGDARSSVFIACTVPLILGWVGICKMWSYIATKMVVC